ncbi:hypothetical protein H072_11342 [Dactylellina haptotyla CBS 200.50]|uniref:Uncharacterized protein n=1 Tax=Dactylellina haptotyla (strain CBS 200.50) TaxID=1284197 RepID=S7ZXZ0_DACHA|nr:hypothetical protein H072_11342 [Dactylellina haptotyla CBS 200.50]
MSVADFNTLCNAMARFKGHSPSINGMVRQFEGDLKLTNRPPSPPIIGQSMRFRDLRGVDIFDVAILPSTNIFPNDNGGSTMDPESSVHKPHSMFVLSSTVQDPPQAPKAIKPSLGFQSAPANQVKIDDRKERRACKRYFQKLEGQMAGINLETDLVKLEHLYFELKEMLERTQKIFLSLDAERNQVVAIAEKDYLKDIIPGCTTYMRLIKRRADVLHRSQNQAERANL